LIHGLFAMTIVFAPSPKNDQGPVSIDLIDLSPGEAKTRYIVDETEDSPPEDELLDKLKQQSALLSQYTKRVKQQQIAKGQGKAKSGNQPGPSTKPLNLNPSANFKKRARNDLRLKPKVQERGEEVFLQDPTQSRFNQTVAIGGSAGADEIPGVKEGFFTALNTDQFKYYSFFSRVKNAIRYRWVSRVRNFVATSPKSEIYKLARVPSPTVLEILLDKDGMVVHINVLKSSGSEALDDAAVQAFYQASPLNHPPEDMINPRDRMVHLNFSFLIRWGPVYMANGQ